MSLQTGVGDEQWMAGWTIFYWAWWVSWAPFVGMFVARISRGRTIREFIVGVVAAPTGFGFFWFAVVGGVGIELERDGKADIVGALATPELSLFTALDALPLPVISSALCVFLIALFFISGADAASVVMATMASRGSLSPSRFVVVVLGVLMGGIACAMLLVGGLTALQQAAVLGSVPFTFVLVGVAWCWVKALREETRERRKDPDPELEPANIQRGSGHVRSRGLRLALVGTALAALTVACGDPNDERDASSQPQGATLRVTLGTQEFPEARILGELWRQALAVNGYAVNLRKGIGPAEDLDDALKDGDIDGYVAYTGTVLSIVAGEEVTGLDPDETYEAAKKFYAGQDMVMSEMTPFENKDAIATTSTYAEENDLTEIGDLAGLDSFVLGARPEFEDLQLGLAGLQEVYGLDNATFAPIELGQQYAALDTGAAAAVDAFTTDPQLETGDYTLLDDPELLFGSQNVVMVCSEDKLDSIDADAFLEVVDAVNRELTEEAMVQMNAEVTDGRSDEAVAREFLRSVDLDQPLRNED